MLEARVALKLEAQTMGDALRGLLGALQLASAQPNTQKARPSPHPHTLSPLPLR